MTKVGRYLCKICGAGFTSGNALKQHKWAKHKSRILATRTLIAATVVAVIAYSVYSGLPTSLFQVSAPVAQQHTERIVMHIHSSLTITIDGRKVTVPARIGFDRGFWKNHDLDRFGMDGMAPLHTHDETGVIHVESKSVRNFNLGNFFDIWGMKLNNTCILDVCNTATHTLKMFVNGRRNFEFREHILVDGEEIILEYSRN